MNQFAESEEVNTQPTNNISNLNENVKGNSKISYSFAEEKSAVSRSVDSNDDVHYQENPDEATDLILENKLGGKENFIDRAIHTKTDEALRREAEKAAKGKARREIVTKRLAEEYAKSVSYKRQRTKTTEINSVVFLISRSFSDMH